ncbi:hypothetical protein HY635_04415 [Candidatus Uhrbacteria bacterium]|nr:hypothetical protein [Candidatus Uhrbacteria bacterium]
MDEQGHGTEQWKSLEHWAFDELMKIVELRDGRTMDGPPALALQDFVGKKLRVRYETGEASPDGPKGFAEQGTLMLTITSVQARRRSIVLGVTPCAFFHEAQGVTHTIRAVLFDRMEEGPITAARFSILRDEDDDHGIVRDTRSDGLHSTNVHILWS